MENRQLEFVYDFVGFKPGFVSSGRQDPEMDVGLMDGRALLYRQDTCHTIWLYPAWAVTIKCGFTQCNTFTHCEGQTILS